MLGDCLWLVVFMCKGVFQCTFNFRSKIRVSMQVQPVADLVSEGNGWRGLFSSARFLVPVCLCGVGRLPLQFVMCFSAVPLPTRSFRAVGACVADNKLHCE